MASGSAPQRAALGPSNMTTEDSIARLPRAEFAAPPSVISSRMTDIASDDGHDQAGPSMANPQRRSALISESASRPGTARTAISSRNWAQANQRRAASRRRSAAGSLTGSSVGTARSQSSASRSHVPSLQSHAFFHPMSSHQLQAQRSVSRPGAVARPPMSLDVSANDNTNPTNHSQNPSLQSNPLAYLMRPLTGESDHRPPPSRGTEITDPGTYDNAVSHSEAQPPTASLTDSMRPLHRRRPSTGRAANNASNPADNKLTINIEKSLKRAAGSLPGLPTPTRSPHSFRSSLLLPTRNGSSGRNGTPNREMHGGEKLESVASSPQLPHADAAAPDSGEKGALSKLTRSSIPAREAKRKLLGRNYEYFQGNTVFCMGGRLQNTRHRPINIATASWVVIPSILFFIFSAPWIWYNMSPAIPIIYAYLFYICISSFIHASSTDPGILPRNLHRFPSPDENEDPLRLAPPTTDWTLVKSADRTAQAMEVPTKYCKTCQMWRPPRAHHCRLCDNCVETQDHHCVWLNNCVGRRNYRYFFAFVASATLLAAYLLAASLAQILVYASRERVSFGTAVGHFRVPFAMFLYGILAVVYPAALMGYHVFLMARGETTREYLNSHKFAKPDRYRAFTQPGWAHNWVAVLCRPRPPTYLSFKEGYVAGDQRLGQTRKARAGGRGGSGGGGGDDDDGGGGGGGGGVNFLSLLGFRGKRAAAGVAAGGRDRQDLEMQAVRPTEHRSVPPQEPGFQGPVALRTSMGAASALGGR